MGHTCKVNPNAPIGIRFSVLARTFKSRIDDKFKDEGLTAVQASTIMTVSRLNRQLGRDVTLKDVQQAQNIAHPTLIEIIKKLEAKEFVETFKCETDKRSRNIRLTSKSDGLLHSINDVSKDVYSSLCEGIDPDEVEIMEKVINKMIINAIGGEN